MTKKVLIIEDDTFLQGLAASKLTAGGFEVQAAKDADEASKLLDSGFDCILLDLLLPGTDGFALLKKIRENLKTAQTPIIVFSNLSEPGDIEKAKSLGATAFMVKANFTLDELVEKVKSIT